MLIQIDSGYFCAAVQVKDGKVTSAAPIIKYMLGWLESRVLEYSDKKGWKIVFIP